MKSGKPNEILYVLQQLMIPLLSYSGINETNRPIATSNHKIETLTVVGGGGKTPFHGITINYKCVTDKM